MTTKEYLQQAYRLDKRINSHIREKEELMQMATSVSSPQWKEDVVQTSKSGDAPFLRTLEKMWELEEQITAEIDKQVSNPDYLMVLRYRYIHNYCWERIGEELLADRRTVIRWHDAAISQLKVPENPIVIDGSMGSRSR